MLQLPRLLGRTEANTMTKRCDQRRPMAWIRWIQCLLLPAIVVQGFSLSPSIPTGLLQPTFATGVSSATESLSSALYMRKPNFTPDDDDDDENDDDENVNQIITPMSRTFTTSPSSSPAISHPDVRLLDLLPSTISPYHILHPNVSPSIFDNHSVAPQSLYVVLQHMRLALENLHQQSPHSTPNTGANENKRPSRRRSRLVRIEHPVASVDILAWLSAQRERLIRQSRLESSFHNGEIHVVEEASVPYFYTLNQEGSLEVAAVGQVLTASHTAEVWEYLDSKATRRHHNDHSDLRSSSNRRSKGQEEANATTTSARQTHGLQEQQPPEQPSTQHDWPVSSRWYGGQRFDDEAARTAFSNATIPPSSPEWDAFLGSEHNARRGSQPSAWWFVPAIELRYENNVTTLAIHLWEEEDCAVHDVDYGAHSFSSSIPNVLTLLEHLSDQALTRRPPTTLPPIVSRSSHYQPAQPSSSWHSVSSQPSQMTQPVVDGQERYQQAVMEAIERFEQDPPENANEHEKSEKDTTHIQTNDNHGAPTSLANCPREPLRKVVLARQQCMRLGVQGRDTNDGSSAWCALAALRRWKYGGHAGGHLFWMRPGRSTDALSLSALPAVPQFFGCTPERLFRVTPDHMVQSEALAGTRPRGSTALDDAQLFEELWQSPKEQRENEITAHYVNQAFKTLQEKGWARPETSLPANKDGVTSTSSTYFVRRLRHLQHLCQAFSARLTDPCHGMAVSRFLLAALHPTPAVCGFPLEEARQFIRETEGKGFDRGLYSGPVGFLGKDASDLYVAIRSALVISERVDPNIDEEETEVHTVGQTQVQTTILGYAGAGIVPGSTVKAEWTETNYKLAVISSLFPQSPISLHSAPNANAAWALVFVEELIRNGVTQFYVCPGSRSTPLVVALVKAARSHVGMVQLTSVHDERSAGFFAIGYARGANRPAAVVTSSGTAVANLYPAVVESSMDGVPLILLTADRPYESRDTGANQAIDQVKMFAGSYVRWFRDILPPSDDVPVSLALSDAAHAVNTAVQDRGPVHVNMQFRENLAPDGGQIRSDIRTGSITRFNSFHFTETPKFRRWSLSGDAFIKRADVTLQSTDTAIAELCELIRNSRRGIIVVGNLRGSSTEKEAESHVAVSEVISDFAQKIGFPIFAGAQNVPLRFRSPSVVPFAEMLLKSKAVSNNLDPDLILQIGAPLVSTELPSIFASGVSSSSVSEHVLIHSLYPSERIDPGFTVTREYPVQVSPFLKEISSRLGDYTGSELASLVTLGRLLQTEMKEIIRNASLGDEFLSEPEVILALSEALEKGPKQSLFLSNSMPIRDSEFFMYPYSPHSHVGVESTGSNRGASGIDGILSTAMGFADGAETPTTLIIGDVSALHDIGALHNAILQEKKSQGRKGASRAGYPVTTILVNNNGGGIFSFLPIAKHGNDVAFDDLFGTPTNSFSFENAASAFGLSYTRVSSYHDLKLAYEIKIHHGHDNMIEAVVVDRERNVAVHRSISAHVTERLERILNGDGVGQEDEVSVETFRSSSVNDTIPTANPKHMVLLHGWMGQISDWQGVILCLVKSLPPNWIISAIDLPGHGQSFQGVTAEVDAIRASLKIVSSAERYTIANIAKTVRDSLRRDHNMKKIDALVGYSLGGRVAIAMTANRGGPRDILTDDTKLVLLSAAISEPLVDPRSPPSIEDQKRVVKDERLAQLIRTKSNRALLLSSDCIQKKLIWDGFLDKWYGAPIWGNLPSSPPFHEVKLRRSDSLAVRGQSLADILSTCSPPKNRNQGTTRSVPVRPANTLFLAGELDTKYVTLGRKYAAWLGIDLNIVDEAGHALLVEAPRTVADRISAFVSRKQLLTIEEIESGYRKSPSMTMFKMPMEDGAHNKPEPMEDEVTQISDRYMKLKAFTLPLGNTSDPAITLRGIGWGSRAASSSSSSQRSGTVVELVKSNGCVGIGEISPLAGLHPESLDDVLDQLSKLVKVVNDSPMNPFDTIDARKVLEMNGYLEMFIGEMLGGDLVGQSVKFGLEMAIAGMAAQELRLPVHRAIAVSMGAGHAPNKIPLNGLMLRGSTKAANGPVTFSSLKVKVGHQTAAEETETLQEAFRYSSKSSTARRLRFDANQAWNDTEAMEFAVLLESVVGDAAAHQVEYIEEPLCYPSAEGQSLDAQVYALERWYRRTGLKYALDESLGQLANSCRYDYQKMEQELLASFPSSRGCAALVLKPALLGLELSIRLAVLARQQLHLGAVFSSSFDTGIGLANTAFLAAASEGLASDSSTRFPHGLGTFEMLRSDTLDPPFSSYVDEHGQLNVGSVARALSGLTMEELEGATASSDPTSSSDPMDIAPQESIPLPDSNLSESSVPEDDGSRSVGGELNIAVSTILPFSAETARSRFTDLPQQPRWSPWLTSVSYDGPETEWKINIRGIPLRWRAKSRLLDRGIEWESVSGVANHGSVIFLPRSSADANDGATLHGDPAWDASCEMQVRITLTPPGILRPLFRRTSTFLEDFIRNKLIQWSLEMFRDVVQADLAVERGDAEMGDALFHAVQGRADALEATLRPNNGSKKNSLVDDDES